MTFSEKKIQKRHFNSLRPSVAYKDNYVIIGTGNGLSLTQGINFSEIQIKILSYSFKKMHLKMLSAKWQPFCAGLNVLKTYRAIKCWCCMYFWMKNRLMINARNHFEASKNRSCNFLRSEKQVCILTKGGKMFSLSYYLYLIIFIMERLLIIIFTEQFCITFDTDNIIEADLYEGKRYFISFQSGCYSRAGLHYNIRLLNG